MTILDIEHFERWEDERATREVDGEVNNVTSYRVEHLLIIPETRLVFWRGREVKGLTERQFQAVELLSRRPLYIFTRRQLLDSLWPDETVQDRSVDTMIKCVRKRFKAVDARFAELQTHYSVGYTWRAGAKRRNSLVKFAQAAHAADVSRPRYRIQSQENLERLTTIVNR